MARLGHFFTNRIVAILINLNTFVLLKKYFYIILFLTGLHISAAAQTQPTREDSSPVKTIRFYPNPAVSYINFEFVKKPEPGDLTLYIFSFIGKKVADIKVSQQKFTLSLNDYFRGVYIFQLRDSKGNIVESGKFQVVK